MLEKICSLNPVHKSVLDNIVLKLSSYLEWFIGIVDSEGTFGIVQANPHNFGFKFEIGLHRMI